MTIQFICMTVRTHHINIIVYTFFFFKISEDFKLEYPQIEHETLSDWSVYIKKWILFSDIIVSVRRSSVKDNHARELLKHLDAAQLRGS